MPYATQTPEGVAISNRAVSDESVEVVELPESKFFRSAYVLSNDKVVVDLVKAQEHAHNLRRQLRDEELVPLDREATYSPETAEPKRVAVREKYAQLQLDIDNASDPVELEELFNDY